MAFGLLKQIRRSGKPNVVVMDLSMPELDGVQATKEVAKHLPDTKVLVLSMHAEDNYVRNALDAGAKGYLLKSAIDVDLVGAIKAVAEGQRYMGSGLKYVAHEADDELNRPIPREKQVLQFIAKANRTRTSRLYSISASTLFLSIAPISWSQLALACLWKT